MSKSYAWPTPSEGRAAFTYRAARRNFARTIRAAGIGERWTHCAAFARSPQSMPLRKFVAANPKASKGEVLDFFRAMAAHKPTEKRPELVKAPEPAAEPPAKPKRIRKPAAPRADVTHAETPKAPRKRAAPKSADAPAKPKAAPRRRAPAA